MLLSACLFNSLLIFDSGMDSAVSLPDRLQLLVGNIEKPLNLILNLISEIKLPVTLPVNLSVPYGFLVLSVLFLIILSLILRILSWLSQYPWFSSIRYFLLWLSRGTGQIYQYLSGGWRPPLVRLANVVVAVWLAELAIVPFLQSNILDQSSILVTVWLHWNEILMIWVLYEASRFVWRASHQLLIKVEDYAGSEGGGNPEITKQKLADLLQVKLNRIGDLYREVDEQRAIRTAGGAGRPIDVSIAAEGASELLKETMSGSDISLGPLRIPVGSIASIIGRLMQGPQIIVGLHSLENSGDVHKFFLTASLIGYKEPSSWLVDSQVPLVESDKSIRSIDDMMTELAHRIFARLAFERDKRPVPWRAVWNFSEGIRAYRDCLHSTKKRKYYLKIAEKKFIETLEEDDKFDLAYYNLGVVYTELKQLEAAEAAFSMAIEKVPNRWDEYYAFGLNLFERTEEREERLCKIEGERMPTDKIQEIIKWYEHIKVLCNYVLEIEIGNFANQAKAYNLRGNVNNRIAQLAVEDLELKDKAEFHSDASINDCETAVKFAWRALYEAEILGENIEDRCNIVSECLIDLAYLHRRRYEAYDTRNTNWHNPQEQDSLRLAEDALKQAERVDLLDSNVHSELGKTYCVWKQYKKAINAFESAVQIAPENSLFWAYLAFARGLDYSKRVGDKYADKSLILSECKNAIDYGSDNYAKALETVAKAYREIGEIEQSLRLKRAAFQEKLRVISNVEARGISCLKKMLLNYEERFKIQQAEGRGSEFEEDVEWKHAQLALVLTQLKRTLDEKEYVKCTKEETEDEYLQLAIEILSSKIDDLNNLGLFEEKSDYSRVDWLKAQDLHVLGRLYMEVNKEDKAELYFGLACNVLRIRSQDETETKREIYMQEYALLQIDLGRMYLRFGRDKEAEDYFNAAITILERNYPDNIKRSMVRVHLAKALSNQRKKYCALKQAQAARIINPISYYERQNVGQIFCTLEEYNSAIEELDNSLSWKPDNPDILIKMGLAHLRKAQTCHSIDERAGDLKKSFDYLSQALELLDKDDLKRRAYVRYWIGKVCLELGECGKAIPHFRVLFKALRNVHGVHGRKKSGELWIVALCLGYAYLRGRDYEHCEEVLEYIINNGKCENETDVLIGTELDDEMVLGEVIAWAYLGISYSYAERDVNLKNAKECTDKAEELINGLRLKDGDSDDPRAEEIEKRVLRIRAALEDCRGRILFKRDRTYDAISYFESSISRRAKSLYYLHLAEAIERKLQTQSLDRRERSLMLRQAKNYCQNAIYMALKGEHSDLAGNLKKRIEAMEAKEPGGSEDKNKE
jgi:tetratricopeptide (TPR) repeat protein